MCLETGFICIVHSIAGRHSWLPRWSGIAGCQAGQETVNLYSFSRQNSFSYFAQRLQ